MSVEAEPGFLGKNNDDTVEDRLIEAVLELARWEDTAIAKVGKRLDFDRNSREPDMLLRTILNCGREIRTKRQTDNSPEVPQS